MSGSLCVYCHKEGIHIMKKLLAILLSVFMLMTLIACDNDETPEVTDTDTQSETVTETETKTENDIKGLYGALNNVRLSVVEYEKIKEKFPKSYKRYIDDLSFYIGEKGDKYTSHYLVILKWNRDKKEDMCSFDTDDFFEAAIRRSEEHIKARLREAEEKKRLTQEVSP